MLDAFPQIVTSIGILVTQMPGDHRYVHSPTLLTPYQMVVILGEVRIDLIEWSKNIQILF